MRFYNQTVNLSSAEVLTLPFVTLSLVSIDKIREGCLEACLVLHNTNYKGKTQKMCVSDRRFAYDRRIRILY